MSDVIAKIVDLQHQVAIREAIVYFLEQYLPSDTGDHPKELLVQDPCMEPVVPASTVERVLDEICTHMEQLNQELDKLKGMEADEQAKEDDDDDDEREEGGGAPEESGPGDDSQ